MFTKITYLQLNISERKIMIIMYIFIHGHRCVCAPFSYEVKLVPVKLPSPEKSWMRKCMKNFGCGDGSK